MYLYTLEEGKLKGLQFYGDINQQDKDETIKAMEGAGRTVIFSDTGITVCKDCKRVLSETGLQGWGELSDGGVHYSRCVSCVAGTK